MRVNCKGLTTPPPRAALTAAVQGITGRGIVFDAAPHTDTASSRRLRRLRTTGKRVTVVVVTGVAVVMT